MSSADSFRRTKIIFTLGPASESEEMLEKLIRAGGDVVRLNMAHASHEWTRKVIRRIRAVSQKCGREVAIMMDIKGPEIRTGDVGVPIELKVGEIFDFTVKPASASGVAGDEEIRSVDVNYKDLVRDIKVGDEVLVDNGLLRLEVLAKDEARIRCRVVIAGELKSRRHINLPGVKVNLPPFTEKDRADTTVGLEEGIDYVALSFVRTAADIEVLRTFLAEKKSKVRIIAKIEDQTAILNLDQIVAACDGLMVARGDLGIECPFEELPIIQRRAVRSCLAQGRPVIVATHMLESMISQPVPTRAEITDVANAVFESADCVMLSGETTTGKYPLECVQMLDIIARRIGGNAGEQLPRGLHRRAHESAALRGRAGQRVAAFEAAHVHPARLHGPRPRPAPARALLDSRFHAVARCVPPPAAAAGGRAVPHAARLGSQRDNRTRHHPAPPRRKDLRRGQARGGHGHRRDGPAGRQRAAPDGSVSRFRSGTQRAQDGRRGFVLRVGARLVRARRWPRSKIETRKSKSARPTPALRTTPLRAGTMQLNHRWTLMHTDGKDPGHRPPNGVPDF